MNHTTIEEECATKCEYNEYYDSDFDITALCVDGIVSYRESEDGYRTCTNRQMFEWFNDAGDHDCDRLYCGHPMRKFEPGIVWSDVMMQTDKTARLIKAERRLRGKKEGTVPAQQHGNEDRGKE